MTHPNLIERLNRKHRVHSGTGGGSISYDKDGNMVASSYVTDDGMRLVNPDGPEAAKAISTLTAEVEELRAEMARRDENERKHCLNWGPCSRMCATPSSNTQEIEP